MNSMESESQLALCYHALNKTLEEAPLMALEVGDKAPDFILAASDGSQLSLKDMAGKKVVIYFYPRDNTPGCTMEACSLRDYNADLKAAGVEVLGVSKDS